MDCATLGTSKAEQQQASPPADKNLLGNPGCSPSLTFRARLESAVWLQHAEAGATSSFRFCNKPLVFCFCATPGGLPELGQVEKAREAASLSLPGKSGQPQVLQGAFADSRWGRCHCPHSLLRSRTKAGCLRAWFVLSYYPTAVSQELPPVF